MKIKLIILFLGCIPYIYSQNTIKGNVFNQNLTPQIGVQVYIEQLHIGTVTNEEGFFELKNFPNGTHQIVFNHLGFQNKIIEVSLSDETKELNITLEESAFHMDEIIVSTPFHKIQNENVIKVDYKTINSLSKNGGISLIENLSNIPGVEDLSTGSGIGKPVIRGLSGNRVLVYTQGVRLENQQYGSEHGLGINEAGIESVEVIKGPASLLYGSDALGGVLFFNPEKFAPTNSNSIHISQKMFSNTLGSNTSIGYKSSKEKFKYLARGTYNTHLDYKIPNGDRVTNTRFNEKDFKFGVGFNSDKYISEIRYNYTNSKLGITDGIENQSNQRNPDLPFQDIGNHIISFHNHLFFKNTKLDIDLGYVSNQRKEFEEHHEDHDEDHDEDDESMKNEAPINLKLNTFTYGIKYQFPKTKNIESLIGVQGLHQKNKNFGEEILIPNANTNDFGIFTSGLFTWNQNNSLQGGIRFDYRNIKAEGSWNEYEMTQIPDIDKSFQNFTASLGYKTSLLKLITTRINVASGYRAPNLAELTSFGVHHGTNRFEIGNPNLESEQNYQFDLSLEYQSKHIEVFINAFHNKINDYIFLNPTAEFIEELEVFKFVQIDSKLYGGEFGFHLHPHPLDWLHLESNFETVTGIQKNGNYLPLIPANKLSNSIKTEFEFNRNIKDIFFSITFQSVFKKTNVSPLENPSDSYSLLNFGTGSHINLKKMDLNINFNITNLLNKSYISHLSTLKVYNIPNIGRNFVLGINIKL